LYEIGYARKEDVLYLDLTEYGIDKHLVLRRADGTSLYSTRDIAYHIYKCKKCDKVLDIFGSDHKLAARQVELALEILEEIEPNSDKMEVIFYEFITLPEGSMSTRRGVFISVDELMDEAVKRAKEEITSRRPELDEATIDEIAEEIGTDLYVLPSSVHELILVSDSYDLNKLKALVKETNEGCVRPVDRLSDTVCNYRRAENDIVLAEPLDIGL
jgi:arginyl-tRNA synthetase